MALVAVGGASNIHMGPTATHIVGGLITAVCVLAVLGYFAQKLQWWLQDRRAAKEDKDRTGRPDGG